ncbi:MAG TPA: CHAT domain-containing protein [Thermoanaerobaculia bacterium]|nr:CHAT domain-containing protein [Thermoanaerobaculia bacterium]
MSLGTRIAAGACLLLLTFPGPSGSAGAGPVALREGVVVFEVAPGSAAERAGLRAGDELAAWSGESGRSGVLRTPFDLGEVKVEQAPRGPITLRGFRAGEESSWRMLPGVWGIEVRPALAPDLLALYEQGRERIGAGDLEAGGALWRSALESLERQAAGEEASWLESRWAKALGNAAQWPEADAAWERAVARLEPQGAPGAAQILRVWGETLQQRSDWETAESVYRRALRLEPEESLAAAWDLSALATLARRRGEYGATEALLSQVFAIRERLAPESLDLASSFHDLATLAALRGDMATAKERFTQSFELRQRLAPESLEMATSLISLGNVASMQGDAVSSGESFRRAIGLLERLSPDHPELARALSALGINEMLRGELAVAEERFRRALKIRQKVAPESLDVAGSLQNLGIIAEKRGDFAAAQELHRRALEMREKLAPGSPNVAESLANLGIIEQGLGNLAEADQYLKRALAIHEKSQPESYGATAMRIQRAGVAVERGDLALAEELYGHALTTLEKQFPGSLQVSDSLEGLGYAALKRSDLAQARERFQRALSIRERMAPGSARVGRSLNHLGQVDRQEGRLPLAAEHFCQATEAFDKQRKKLGGAAEGRLAFGGAVAEYYRDCLAALVDVGRPEEAFLALERGRARSFLDLLAERDLEWTSALPPELDRERKQVDSEYDRTQAALGRLSPVRDQAEVDRLLARLQELRARQEEISEKIRRASPQIAALQDPRPLSLAEARNALDPGTVLLSWTVGKERSFLFVVQPAGAPGGGLDVFPILKGDAALREEVESFRLLLKRPDSDRAALQAQARGLYDLLVRPAEARIAGAERLLLSPDGPLHTLPFAALMRGDGYFIEWKPLHSVLSATVYSELARSRPPARERGEEKLIAFGDPAYRPLTPDAAADPEVREAVRSGLALVPLPSSGREVKAIASLYPEARVYLGADATEERAKSIGPESRLIHFACHGILDERFPLNSALALTLPKEPAEGQDNGLLQAWEIFESVRLDADLVTLSACDTALGREMGGEGLVGLTRAFQYAGARSVLASLWSVSDLSTARFMKRFYGYLRSGKPKDEALQAAQIDQIREKSVSSSHPFHWAAFQLTGDWK